MRQLAAELQVPLRVEGHHEAGREFEPKAERPTPGALDLCFLAAEPLDAVMRRLDRKSTRLNSSHIQKSRMPSSA